jgi:hypothetical protein
MTWLFTDEVVIMVFFRRSLMRWLCAAMYGTIDPGVNYIEEYELRRWEPISYYEEHRFFELVLLMVKGVQWLFCEFNSHVGERHWETTLDRTWKGERYWPRSSYGAVTKMMCFTVCSVDL